MTVIVHDQEAPARLEEGPAVPLWQRSRRTRLDLRNGHRNHDLEVLNVSPCDLKHAVPIIKCVGGLCARLRGRTS